MPHRTFNLDEVADYLHLARDQVERLMRESDLPHQQRGARLVFPRLEVEEWASRRILGLSEKRLDGFHERLMHQAREVLPGAALIPELLSSRAINLELAAKTKPSVIREMVRLAEGTGRLFDAREFQTSVEAREELCPTAIEGGLALLHARHFREYRFETSFLVLGRTLQPVGFGAPDGYATSLFFLICCEDERLHLHTLARLCQIAAKTKILQEMRSITEPDAALEAWVAAEQRVLPAPPSN